MTSDSWPPLLSSHQMHQAVNTTLEWADRSLERFDELQGCALQLHNHALLVREFAENQLEAGQQQTFLQEDRERLRRRVRQINNTMEVVKYFIAHTQTTALRPLMAITDECDGVDSECVQIIFHDSDEDDEAEIP